MPFSDLKHRLFGRLISSRDRNKLFERNILEHERLLKKADSIDLTDIATREGDLMQKRRSLTDMAQSLITSQPSSTLDKSMLSNLRQIYSQLGLLSREERIIAKMRETLIRSKMSKEAELTTVMLERNILAEHDRAKLRRWTRPPISSVTRKMDKLQLQKEMDQDLVRDYVSSLSDTMEDVEEKEGVVDEMESQFLEWLQSLQSEKVQEKGINCMEGLEERIQSLKIK